MDLIEYYYICETVGIRDCLNDKCPNAGLCRNFDHEHINLIILYAEGEI